MKKKILLPTLLLLFCLTMQGQNTGQIDVSFRPGETQTRSLTLELTENALHVKGSLFVYDAEADGITYKIQADSVYLKIKYNKNIDPDKSFTSDVDFNIPGCSGDTYIVMLNTEVNGISRQGVSTQVIRSSVTVTYETGDKKEKQDLDYSLDNNKLNIKGYLFTNCCGHHSLICNIVANEIIIERYDAEPLCDCEEPHLVDISIPGCTLASYKVRLLPYLDGPSDTGEEVAVNAEPAPPIGADGTMWQYVHTTVSSFNVYHNVVDGDTTVNGRSYKKVYAYPQYGREYAVFSGAFREEGQKIYAPSTEMTAYLPQVNGETLLYDFSLKEGDKFGNDDRYIVGKTDYIEIDGKLRKRIAFNGHDTWVEGIGSIERAFGFPLSALPTNGSRTVLEVFEQNGKTVYGEQRFNLLTDGVRWTERHSTENSPNPTELSPYFDLEEFYVKGDTIFNEITYKKIYRYGRPSMYLREGKNGKIFYYTEDGERLLYDFGWKATSGPALSYQNRDGSKVDFQVSENYYAYADDGHCYEYFQVKYSPFTYHSHTKDIRLYMGIGLTAGIFTHLYEGDIKCHCFKDLVSVYDKENKLIYQNPLFKENGEFVTSVASLDVQPRLSVINRGKEVEFIRKDPTLPDGEKLFIYDNNGRLLSIRSLEKGRALINDLPAGIYVYRLKEEKGQFAVGK